MFEESWSDGWHLYACKNLATLHLIMPIRCEPFLVCLLAVLTPVEVDVAGARLIRHVVLRIQVARPPVFFDVMDPVVVTLLWLIAVLFLPDLVLTLAKVYLVNLKSLPVDLACRKGTNLDLLLRIPRDQFLLLSGIVGLATLAYSLFTTSELAC